MLNNDSMRISATTEHLSDVRAFIRSHIAALKFSDQEANNVLLAVDEACSNLIQHAYKNDASREIEISVKIEKTKVIVTIGDSSSPFDPNTAELPDMEAYFKERRHHGLGIMLMTRVMDDIQYLPASAPSGTNKLVLTKNRHV